MSDKNLYPVPKIYTRIYASNLNIGTKASQEDRTLAQHIRDLFEIGPKQENYVNFFKHLLWYEEIEQKISLQKYNMKNVQLQFIPTRKIYKLKVSGLSKNRPSLILGDKLIVKDDINNKWWEFFVKDIEHDYVFIETRRKNFYFYYLINATFDVHFVLSRRSFIEQHDVVHNIMYGNFKSRIFPQNYTVTRHIDPILTYYNSEIERNKEQCLAVRHILAGTSGTAPFLLHGPPGTGKTVTIVESILQLVKQSPYNRIMVCTSSNNASDHVASGLIKYNHLFKSNIILHRDYSKSKESEIPENLWQYSNNRTSKSTLTSYSVVVITLGHVAGFCKKLKEERKGVGRYISHLFIDEAAQASEPECLIPIYKLLTECGTVVLAGDPYQLGPVIMSKHAKNFGLGISLMERLQKTCTLYLENDPKYTVMLKNNFRSHPHILALPNKLFYDGQLNVCAKKDPISDICILDQKYRCNSIVFHGVLSEELFDKRSHSYSNDMEFEIVQFYIKYLLVNHHVLSEDIGVITPYNKQVFKIQNWLKECDLNAIEVGSVERFQGKEKRIIIISTVRGKSNVNSAKDIKLGFLVDEKRFNVALTRGKAKVIVIGNSTYLRKDSNWRDYIDECRTLGSYYFSNESKIYKAKINDMKLLTKSIAKLSLK